MQSIEIETPDGVAPALLWPDNGPSVLFLMDGLGMRPGIVDVAAKIAAHGYRVLAPDLFYRLGSYAPLDAKAVMANPEQRNAWFGRVMAIMTPENIERDLKAYLDHLAVPKVGVVGYCMGGRLAFVAAGKFPERIAAAAAYHPGGLVSDKPDSPHLLAPNVKAKVYIGAAEQDQNFDAAAIATFTKALVDARIDHTLEVYAAKHGWVPEDTAVHDPVAAKKSYETLYALFESAFG